MHDLTAAAHPRRCLLCAGCNKVVTPEEFIAAPNKEGEMKQWRA